MIVEKVVDIDFDQVPETKEHQVKIKLRSSMSISNSKRYVLQIVDGASD